MANAYAIITEANRRLDMGAITLGEWESEIAEWKDAEPVRHGHWKVVKSSIHPYGNDVACSVCGFKMGSSFGCRFCPNCGAQMDGERREDGSEAHEG